MKRGSLRWWRWFWMIHDVERTNPRIRNKSAHKGQLINGSCWTLDSSSSSSPSSIFVQLHHSHHLHLLRIIKIDHKLTENEVNRMVNLISSLVSNRTIHFDGQFGDCDHHYLHLHWLIHYVSWSVDRNQIPMIQEVLNIFLVNSSLDHSH